MAYKLPVNEDEWGADICSHPPFYCSVLDVSTLALILRQIKMQCCHPGREEVLAIPISIPIDKTLIHFKLPLYHLNWTIQSHKIYSLCVNFADHYYGQVGEEWCRKSEINKKICCSLHGLVEVHSLVSFYFANVSLHVDYRQVIFMMSNEHSTVVVCSKYSNWVISITGGVKIKHPMNL